MIEFLIYLASRSPLSLVVVILLACIVWSLPHLFIGWVIEALWKRFVK